MHYSKEPEPTGCVHPWLSRSICLSSYLPTCLARYSKELWGWRVLNPQGRPAGWRAREALILQVRVWRWSGGRFLFVESWSCLLGSSTDGWGPPHHGGWSALCKACWFKCRSHPKTWASQQHLEAVWRNSALTRRSPSRGGSAEMVAWAPFIGEVGFQKLIQQKLTFKWCY